VPINLYVAVSPLWVMAELGQIPWKKSVDLKWFKKQTMGSVLVMGRKTWESLGKRCLPGRETVVISSTQQTITTFPSIEMALEASPNKVISIVGGREVYRSSLSMIDTAYVTVVKDYQHKSDDIITFPHNDPEWKNFEVCGNYNDSLEDTSLDGLVFSRKA
jgi:dihydrofolate reductase